MVMGRKYNIGFRQLIQDELKSINKRLPAFLANIIHVSRGVFHEWDSPGTPNFWVIHPPCIAIFTRNRTSISYRTKTIH